MGAVDRSVLADPPDVAIGRVQRLRSLGVKGPLARKCGKRNDAEVLRV